MGDLTQPALVLDESVSRANAEPVHFAGFPGLWLHDTPVAVSELGFGEDVDVYELVDELGLPLVATNVADGEGRMPEQPNHVNAGEELVAITDDEIVVAEELPPPDPYGDAVALKAEDLIPAVETADDLAWLDGIEQAEQASKARSTVLSAIADRRTVLETAAAEAEAARVAAEEAGS